MKFKIVRDLKSINVEIDPKKIKIIKKKINNKKYLTKAIDHLAYQISNHYF